MKAKLKALYLDALPYLILISGITFFVGIAAVVAYGGGTYQCWQRWSDSEMPYRFTALKGCQIKSERNGWIPEERYREISN